MHLRQAYIFCARSVCIGYVFSEICQLSPFGSHKLVVAYVLQGVISVSDGSSLFKAIGDCRIVVALKRNRGFTVER